MTVPHYFMRMLFKIKVNVLMHSMDEGYSRRMGAFDILELLEGVCYGI